MKMQELIQLWKDSGTTQSFTLWDMTRRMKEKDQEKNNEQGRPPV